MFSSTQCIRCCLLFHNISLAIIGHINCKMYVYKIQILKYTYFRLLYTNEEMINFCNDLQRLTESYIFIQIFSADKRASKVKSKTNIKYSWACYNRKFILYASAICVRYLLYRACKKLLKIVQSFIYIYSNKNFFDFVPHKKRIKILSSYSKFETNRYE